MLKRGFDILCSLTGIVFLSPLLLYFYLIIKIKDGTPVLFKQERIGRNSRPFMLYKFRSMRLNSEALGQLSLGERDPRVTDIGHFLRKTKMDELPQLFNILKGDMSLVGPRPEVPCYVDMYSDEQKLVLKVRPGLTDAASLKYFNESELLSTAEDPEQFYIKEIMPSKLDLNLKYIASRSLLKDICIILKTIGRIFSKKEPREHS